MTEVCAVNRKKEGNKAGEDLPGSRWLCESLSSPGMERGREIRRSKDRSGELDEPRGTLQRNRRKQRRHRIGET